jgi:hypothetical protein
VLVATLPAYGSSGSPPDGKTGRPGEGRCSDCHQFTGSEDSTALIGFPGDVYQPDSVYEFELGIGFAGQRRWGFELTAADSAANPAGRLIVLDTPNTQMSVLGGFEYIKHTGPGTRPGTPGPTTWRIGWRAPPEGTGPVTFYWCGLAANSNGVTSGDYALPDQRTVRPLTGAIEESRESGLRWFYPNPVRERVVIDYSGKDRRPVTIRAADGRVAAVIRPMPGPNGLRLVWNGRDRRGRAVPAGSYFAELDRDVAGAVRILLAR